MEEDKEVKEIAQVPLPEIRFSDGIRNEYSLEWSESINDNFLKSLQFSPDGSCLLSSSENGRLQVWNVTDNGFVERNKYYYYSSTTNESTELAPVQEISTDVKISNPLSMQHDINAGESVFDCKWHPYANAQDSNSFCFATTCRDHPIHIWDATTGTIRGTYRSHNHLDELDTANCLTFNLTGERIYSGSNRMIRCFDVANPGCGHTDIPTCKSRRDVMGQKGIISALSFNPDYSGAYAAGSFNNSVCIYVEDMEGTALEIHGLAFGVTHLKWSPNGCLLWVGGRKSPDIVCWDVRNTRTQVGKVTRSLQTNQRMSFDLDPWGNFLATGTQDGEVLIYDATTFELLTSSGDFKSDCVNSCVFHPFSSILATATGQRHFDTADFDGDDNESSDESEGETNEDNQLGGTAKRRKIENVMPTPTQSGALPSKRNKSCIELFSFNRIPVTI